LNIFSKFLFGKFCSLSFPRYFKVNQKLFTTNLKPSQGRSFVFRLSRQLILIYSI